MNTYEIIKEGEKYNVYYYDGERLLNKEFHSLDGINGTIRSGFILKDGPNWTKLEQDLRYFNGGALFGKALMTATPNPFSIFLKTLENGSKGIASQNALAYAFSILGVSWTQEEIGQLNILLSQNNFSFQL